MCLILNQTPGVKESNNVFNMTFVYIGQRFEGWAPFESEGVVSNHVFETQNCLAELNKFRAQRCVLRQLYVPFSCTQRQYWLRIRNFIPYHVVSQLYTCAAYNTLCISISFLKPINSSHFNTLIKFYSEFWILILQTIRTSTLKLIYTYEQ